MLNYRNFWRDIQRKLINNTIYDVIIKINKVNEILAVTLRRLERLRRLRALQGNNNDHYRNIDGLQDINGEVVDDTGGNDYKVDNNAENMDFEVKLFRVHSYQSSLKLYSIVIYIRIYVKFLNTS